MPPTSTALTLTTLLLAGLGGCKAPDGPAPGPQAATATSPATPPPAATASAAPPTTASAACAALAELNTLDPRTPVPLQPMMAWHQKQNMQEHLVAIERITGALARDDFEAIISAAALIESSPQMQRMCQHMGAGAEGFTPLALEFHQRADQIAVAARAKDGAGVLKATAHTLQACTGCHARYRQDVVDAATWQARTGSAHDPAAHGHEAHGHEAHGHEAHGHEAHGH